MIGHNRSIDINRWGYVFLVTDSRLSEEERMEMMAYATIMCLNKRKTRTVK